MKIHELSKLTDINDETIRMYRKKGFLHPKKLENGYYDYSMEDFASLVHLRKMREFQLSLDEISHQQHHVSQQEYLEVLNDRIYDLDNQIQQLQDCITFLQLEKQHIANAFSKNDSDVQIMQSTDIKIDFYDEHIFHHPFHNFFPSFYINTTIPLFVSKDILNGEIIDQEIPLKVGIGTYKFMLDRHYIDVPKDAVTIPNGKFISQLITLSDLSTINIKDLEPMMSYAKSHHTPFISDTTAYLATIHYEDGIPHYTFRIRACIEENDIHK